MADGRRPLKIYRNQPIIIHLFFLNAPNFNYNNFLFCIHLLLRQRKVKKRLDDGSIWICNIGQVKCHIFHPVALSEKKKNYLINRFDFLVTSMKKRYFIINVVHFFVQNLYCKTCCTVEQQSALLFLLFFQLFTNRNTND